MAYRVGGTAIGLKVRFNALGGLPHGDELQSRSKLGADAQHKKEIAAPLAACRFRKLPSD